VANTSYIGTLGQFLAVCLRVPVHRAPVAVDPRQRAPAAYFFEAGGSSTYQGHAHFDDAFWVPFWTI
jgi:hypothetical protein